MLNPYGFQTNMICTEVCNATKIRICLCFHYLMIMLYLLVFGAFILKISKLEILQISLSDDHIITTFAEFKYVFKHFL